MTQKTEIRRGALILLTTAAKALRHYEGPELRTLVDLGLYEAINEAAEALGWPREDEP